MDNNSSPPTQHVANGNRKMCRTYNMHPLVAVLFAAAQTQGVPLKRVATKAGLSEDAIYDWRNRTNPTVPNLEACLNVLGLELTIREREE